MRVITFCDDFVDEPGQKLFWPGADTPLAASIYFRPASKAAILTFRQMKGLTDPSTLVVNTLAVGRHRVVFLGTGPTATDSYDEFGDARDN